jgi:3-oxoacyl-[acyl-carrier-protein] synthase-1
MKNVWIISDATLSPLGQNSGENFAALKKGQSGISITTDPALSYTPVATSKISFLQKEGDASSFETLCIQAIRAATRNLEIPADRTLFVLSTTKGNIRFLEEGRSSHSRIHLPATAEFLARYFGFSRHLVVSNACISGVMALTVAKRFLQNGLYDHALVVGADELSRFVVSGFQSLHALSDELCKPFDASRKGINLGEAAAAMFLTVKPEAFGMNPSVRIVGAGLTNDANHISGPSRTGEELCSAITAAMRESEISSDDIDFISAHGTATAYNDEMESKAFTLAGLGQTPVNSLKGYYGHTLGAAGVLESVMGMHALLNNTLIPSFGFSQSGTSQPLNVIRNTETRPLKTFLKTASGFGGCNAAILFQKV